jgi:hypothetical protein
MPDSLQIGNDPGLGTFQVLAENGTVRASLTAVATAVRIAQPGRPGGIALPADRGRGFDLQNSPDSVGELQLFNPGGVRTAIISGDGTAAFGANGVPGTLRLLTTSGQAGVQAYSTANQATILLGGPGFSGNILLYDEAGAPSIALNGGTGDITLGNADCAEEFDVADDVVPGAVVAATVKGLVLADRAYDRRVVGVVSGLGRHRPALVLDRRPSENRRLPVAVVGKVTCLVDADYGPIRCGDLLTSSPRPGYAMVATDHAKAFGCVIGKSLSDVAAGQSTTEILVMSR